MRRAGGFDSIALCSYRAHLERKKEKKERQFTCKWDSLFVSFSHALTLQMAFNRGSRNVWSTTPWLLLTNLRDRSSNHSANFPRMCATLKIMRTCFLNNFRRDGISQNPGSTEWEKKDWHANYKLAGCIQTTKEDRQTQATHYRVSSSHFCHVTSTRLIRAEHPFL